MTNENNAEASASELTAGLLSRYSPDEIAASCLKLALERASATKEVGAASRLLETNFPGTSYLGALELILRAARKSGRA